MTNHIPEMLMTPGMKHFIKNHSNPAITPLKKRAPAPSPCLSEVAQLALPLATHPRGDPAPQHPLWDPGPALSQDTRRGGQSH